MKGEDVTNLEGDQHGVGGTPAWCSLVGQSYFSLFPVALSLLPPEIKIQLARETKHGVGGTPADHIESWTNHDPPCAGEVAQSCRRTLSFESSI